jgi:hypothetical protein
MRAAAKRGSPGPYRTTRFVPDHRTSGFFTASGAIQMYLQFGLRARRRICRLCRISWSLKPVNDQRGREPDRLQFGEQFLRRRPPILQVVGAEGVVDAERVRHDV